MPASAPPVAAGPRIRSRRGADLAPLGAALLEQQARTRYPFRDPLPMPVEQFLHGHDADRAWAAELAGEPVGHVCLVGSSRTGGGPTHRLDAICAEALGCSTTDLTWVSALFVAAAVRGTGIGARLLGTAVEDARHRGLRPCLEVLPVHPAAMSLYTSRGWRVVHRLRPDWLVSDEDEQPPDVHVMVLDDVDAAGDR